MHAVSRLFSQAILKTPTFFLPIQRIASIENCQEFTYFKMVDYKLHGLALEMLIKYNSSEDPKVRALLDESTNRFYLVGGKTAKPIVKIDKAKDMVMVTLAKTNQAMLSLDLSSLKKSGTLEIFKREPAVFAGYPRTLIREADDALLLKLSF